MLNITRGRFPREDTYHLAIHSLVHSFIVLPPYDCISKWSLPVVYPEQNASDSGSASTPPRRGFISLGWQAPYGASAASFKGKVLSGHTGGVVAMTAHPRRVDGQPWLALSG